MQHLDPPQNRSQRHPRKNRGACGADFGFQPVPRALLRAAGLGVTAAVLAGAACTTAAAAHAAPPAEVRAATAQRSFVPLSLSAASHPLARGSEPGAVECPIAKAAITRNTVTGTSGSVLYDYQLRQFRWFAGSGNYTLELDLAPSVTAGSRVRITFENAFASWPDTLEINGVQVARAVSSESPYGANNRASTWVEYEFLPSIDSLVDRRISFSSFYEFYGLGDLPALGTQLTGRVSSCMPVLNADLGVVLATAIPMGVTSSYASVPGAGMNWQLSHHADAGPAGAQGRRIEVVLSNPHEYRLNPRALKAASYAVNDTRLRPIIGTEQQFDVQNGLNITELPNGDVGLSFVAPRLGDHRRFVVHVSGSSALVGQHLDPHHRQITGSFRVDGGAAALVSPEAGYGSVGGKARPVGPPMFEKTLDGDRGYLLRISNPSEGDAGYVVRPGTAVDRFVVNGDTATPGVAIVEPSRGTAAGNTWTYPMLQPGESITASVPFNAAAWLQAGGPRIVTSVNSFGLEGMGECVTGPVLLEQGTECSKVDGGAPPRQTAKLQIDKAQLGEPVLAEDGTAMTVSYRIEVRNTGAVDAWADAAVVRDTFPEGAREVTLVTPPTLLEGGVPESGPHATPADAPAGTFDPQTGVWDGFSLNGGAAAAMEYSAVLPVPEAGEPLRHVNRATVEAGGLAARAVDAVCVANDTLDADDDQCDEVTTVADPPPATENVAPPPAPQAPDVPAQVRLAVTGGDRSLLMIAAVGGVLLVGGAATAGAATVRARRRRNSLLGSGMHTRKRGRAEVSQRWRSVA